jgi:hypothetical protein
VVQHARRDRPDLRHGYSIDDGARALIAVAWYADVYGPGEVRDLAPIYLTHIKDAQRADGLFHNFKDKNGNFLDDVGSQDACGRALWALGIAASSNLVDRDLALSLFQKSEEHAHTLQHPRSIAFALLGFNELGDAGSVWALGDKLVKIYKENATPGWHWFGSCLTYSNAILPFSLLHVENEGHRKVGKEGLDFLNKVCKVDGVPAPVGFDGWYCRGKQRALYGQQAVDAADMVLGNLKMFELSSVSQYSKEALDWFGWFYGNNLKKAIMVTGNGSCYDGIWEKKINTNQGAESTIVYLLAHLAFAKMLDAHRDLVYNK